MVRSGWINGWIDRRGVVFRMDPVGAETGGVMLFFPVGKWVHAGFTGKDIIVCYSFQFR